MISRRWAVCAVCVGLVVGLIGCGTITPGAASGAGGAAGGARDGTLVELGGGGAAGGAPACGQYGDAAFSYNIGQACGDAGRCLPGSPGCCYAACELNGAHFVGCAADARGDGGIIVCHASCAECR